MCLSSPFVFIYIRLFPLKSNTPFTQIACFSAGLRHAASVAKAADSLGGAPGFQVAGRQVGSAAPPQTPAPPPTIEDGAQRFLGGGGSRVRSLVTVKPKARERQCGGRDGSACGCERPPHSRTLTPTDARALTHAHAHSHTPAYTTHVLTAHSHPPTRSHVHTHTHTPPTHTPHALTYTLSHSHSHTRAHHAHTHTRTLTHTPTHTHPCAAMIRLTSTATKRAGGTVTLAGSSETRGAVARGGSECGFGVCRPAVYQMRD